MKRTLISMSGGGTKIAALHGACTAVQKLRKDINTSDRLDFAGVSAGAILAFANAFSLVSYEKLIHSYTLEGVFGQEPGSFLWNMEALYRLFTGKRSLSSMRGLRKMLYEATSKTWYENSPNQVFVGVTNMNTKQLEVIRLGAGSGVSYEKAIEYVIASASIPVMTSGVILDGNLYMDGGLVDHNIGAKVIAKGGYSNAYSIYARQQYTTTYSFPKKKWSILDVVGQTVDICLREISNSDAKIEAHEAKVYNVGLVQVFMNAKMPSNPYEHSPELTDNLISIGYTSALQALR